MELLGAYAAMDGSMEKCNDTMTLMSQFCQSTKKSG
jgi:hypothetical protein